MAMQPWLMPPGQQRQPGLGGQLAGKAATKIAANQIGKLGLGAAGTAVGGPIGGAIGQAAGELAAPLAGQLVSGLFNKGGAVYKQEGGSMDLDAFQALLDGNLDEYIKDNPVPAGQWDFRGQNKHPGGYDPINYKDTGGKATGKKKSIWGKIADKVSSDFDRRKQLFGKGKPYKPKYKSIGGMTPGPLGFSDMIIAGKGKDVSSVKIKKNMGDMGEEVELNYHPPLKPKSEGE